MSTKSLHAFQELLKNDSRTSGMKTILGIIKERPHTIQSLELSVTFKLSTITARLTDLRELGYIDYKTQPYGGQSWIVYVESERDREKIRKTVQDERKEKWLKLGKANGWI